MGNDRLNGLAPIADDQTEVLILGSFPGAKSLLLGAYYSDSRNRFWELVARLIGQPATDAHSERCAGLLRSRLGVWDVIRSCKREGSSDRTIVDAEPNDLGGFLARHERVHTILFNGRSPREYLLRFSEADRVKIPKSIVFGLLASSSGLNTHLSLREKSTEWDRQIRKAFGAD